MGEGSCSSCRPSIGFQPARFASRCLPSSGEAGCTPHQIQSITGHKNLQEVKTYTKALDQLRLAESAIAKLANPADRLANLTTLINWKC
jgi:hypothetical protein